MRLLCHEDQSLRRTSSFYMPPSMSSPGKSNILDLITAQIFPLFPKMFLPLEKGGPSKIGAEVTDRSGRARSGLKLIVPNLSHIARGPCSFQSHQSPPHFHQPFTSPSFKWKKIQPASSSLVSRFWEPHSCSQTVTQQNRIANISPQCLYLGVEVGSTYLKVTVNYCNQEVILMISDNGAISVTKKALVISPCCTRVWLNATRRERWGPDRS